MTDLFSGASLKAERAKGHLLELQSAIREVTVGEYVKILTGIDAQSGKFKITLKGFESITGSVSLIIGDVIHNLRSALDHTAVALTVPPIGNGNVDDTYFPTGKNRLLFLEARDGITAGGRKTGRPGKMKGAPPDALRLVEDLEPYDGGKHSVRALHDLDILDKHKLLIPAISRIRIDRFDVSFCGITKSLGVTDFQTYDDGAAIVALFDFPGAGLHELKYDGQFKASFDVIFEQGQPLGGQDVVVTLLRISDEIAGFIHACRVRFN